MPRPARFAYAHILNAARPHYVFRPRQLVVRVLSDLRTQPPERRFTLPWGADIVASPRDTIGEALVRRGIFDLLVCEILLRLADPGETAIDAGANIGQMTSLLAHAVGPAGLVVAVEPHPQVFRRLSANVARWNALATIEPYEVGLSDADAEAVLSTGVFAVNQGSATLEPWTEGQTTVERLTVAVTRLDTLLGEGIVGVMKMDIEGHELSALHGAAAALTSRQIRDIVFEERDTPPTPVTRLLEQQGYTVLRLGETLRGPVMSPLGAPVVHRDDPSFLATLDPDRAARRIGERGWATYGIGPAGRSERRRRGSR